MLRKGSLLCIYGTVFTTLRHQSIYWLPKCAIKDVPPFPLYNSAHPGWSVQACSRVQNPVRHEPVLPANWSCSKPQAQALQPLPIYLCNHLKGGCRWTEPAFFSDAQSQDQIRGDWNKLKQEDPPKHFKTCSVVMVTEHWLPVLLKNPSGNTPGHPALGGHPRGEAWGQIISRGPT